MTGSEFTVKCGFYGLAIANYYVHVCGPKTKNEYYQIPKYGHPSRWVIQNNLELYSAGHGYNLLTEINDIAHMGVSVNNRAPSNTNLGLSGYQDSGLRGHSTMF